MVSHNLVDLYWCFQGCNSDDEGKHVLLVCQYTSARLQGITSLQTVILPLPNATKTCSEVVWFSHAEWHGKADRHIFATLLLW